MKKRKQLAALGCMAVICLTGCGAAKAPEAIETSTVVVTEKGKITAHLVADFDKTYYDMSELTTMAKEEAEEFNSSKLSSDEKPVVVEQAELLDNSRIKLTYQFDSWETYTEFNEGKLFFGTVNEAAEEGYLSGATLKSVRDGSTMTEEQLKQDGDRKMIITDADADIYCPGKVIYISEGAAVNEDGSVAAAQADGLVYILMK